MRSRFVLPAVHLLATVALFGWFAASGQLAKVFAQDKKVEPPAARGEFDRMVLPIPDPPTQPLK